ncbi:MAG: hypothetical protein ACM308_06755 [Qipengyuania vulgaris]
MLDTISPDLLGDLKQRHEEPQRFYHDWSHVEALLGHFRKIEDRIHDREGVLHAILFHDAVYDPRAKDNERRSAALLVETHPVIDGGSLLMAETAILATEGHRMPEADGDQASDIAHFLDMDLAILGASPERFDIYEGQVRSEYAHVPEDAFRKGRAAVLEGFAARERLYFSDWGYSRFEERARENLARSVEALSTAN